MDLFGKKRIAELEQKVERLKEEKEGILMLYSTTIKNHEQLEDKVRLLELDIKDSEMMIKDREEKINAANKKIGKLYDRIEKLEKDYEEVHSAFEDRDNSAYMYRKEVEELRAKLEKYRIVVDRAASHIECFRILRGGCINASTKRIRNEYVLKLAKQIEKIFKEILG